MQNHKIKYFSLLSNSFGFLAFIWHFIAVALHHCSRGSNTSKELELSLGRSGRLKLTTFLKIYLTILGVKQYVFIKIDHIDTCFTIEVGFASPRILMSLLYVSIHNDVDRKTIWYLSPINTSEVLKAFVSIGNLNTVYSYFSA